MKNRKTLLISLLRDGHRNLGCLSLFASLKNSNIESAVLFIPKHQEYIMHEVKNFIKNGSFDVVGISLMTDSFRFAKLLTEDIKKYAPNVHLIWGGIHPTLMPEECLAYADSVCIGEGEKALVSLVKKNSLNEPISDIPGIGIKLANGQVSITPPILERDMDSLAFNKYDWSNFYVQDALGLRSFNITEYIRYSRHNGEDYTLMATRSCPFSCSYCCNSFLNKLYNNNRVRKRSVDNVVQEIKYAINYIGGIKFINFMDDQFFSSKEWNEEFITKYKKEVNLPFIVRLVPGSFTENDLKRLKDAGLMFVQSGIQSGSEKTNRMVFNRKFYMGDIIEASRIFSRNKIHPHYDVIIQNDLETDYDRDKTIEVLLDLKKPFFVILYALTPFPKTRLEEIYKERGIKPRTNPYETGYAVYDDNDIYFQLASIISFTPALLSRLFFKHSKRNYGRFLLRQYYRATKRLRNRTITAQSKK